MPIRHSSEGKGRGKGRAGGGGRRERKKRGSGMKEVPVHFFPFGKEVENAV